MWVDHEAQGQATMPDIPDDDGLAADCAQLDAESELLVAFERYFVRQFARNPANWQALLRSRRALMATFQGDTLWERRDAE